MFEKEADYRKARKASKDRITKVIKVWSAREETIHDEGFQKGAEFGYNKANEWHYVKDGDLPKDESSVLLYLDVDDYSVGQFSRGRFWCDNCGWYETDEIIAWKEIVLPELPKEDK